MKDWRIILFLCLLLWGSMDAFALRAVPQEPPCTGDFGQGVSRARYYKPELGRFWTMDSFEGRHQDPLSLHKYLYCQANPVNRLDPSGNMDFISIQAVTGIMFFLGSHYINTSSSAIYAAETMFGQGDFVGVAYGLDVVGTAMDVTGVVTGGAAAVTVGYKAIRYGAPAIIKGGTKFAKYLNRLVKETNNGKVVVLGLDSHLDDWADTVNWEHWIKRGDPEALSKWKGLFEPIMGNSNNKIVFVLDDVDVWQGVQRAASGHGTTATDWELLVIKESPQWWDRIVWTRSGSPVENPFK